VCKDKGTCGSARHTATSLAQAIEEEALVIAINVCRCSKEVVW
jgi:hypothetical protein